MTEVINCPECERKLRVPENMLGKKVKCPSCQTIFVAGSAGAEEKPAPSRPAGKAPSARSDAIEETPRRRSPPPPPPEEEEDRPVRRRAREQEEELEEEELEEVEERRGSSGWERIRTGVTYLIISTFVQIGGIVLFPILGCLGLLLGVVSVAGAAVGAQNNPAQMQGAVMGVGIGIILFYGLILLWLMSIVGIAIAGFAMYLKAPIRHGVSLTGLGMATFILYCCVLGLPLLAIATFFIHPIVGLGFFVLWCLSWLGGFYSSLFLLRGTCQAVGGEIVARTIMAHIISWASTHGVHLMMLLGTIAMVGTTFFGFATMGGPRGGPPGQKLPAIAILHGSVNLMNILGILLGLVYLGLFVWYVIILFQVRGALDSFLRRR